MKESFEQELREVVCILCEVTYTLSQQMRGCGNTGLVQSVVFSWLQKWQMADLQKTLCQRDSVTQKTKVSYPCTI